MKNTLKREQPLNFGIVLAIMIAVLIFMFFAAIGAGRYSVSLTDVVKIIISKFISIPQTWDSKAETVVLSLRLRRIIAAVFVGGALSLSGATYQGVFKNPLVGPDMLGVSGGACVGASLGILLEIGSVGIQLTALLGGLLAVALAVSIPRLIKNQSMMTLVLAGVIVSGITSSLLGLLKYLADPETHLASITHWQLGSLTAVSWPDVFAMGPPILIAMAVLLLLRWRINILSLGENEAKSLGVDLKWIRGLMILCATILTACATCVSGTIGWIGLVIPHFGRMIVGPDNRKLIPASIVLGALFLLIIDTLARVLSAAELPLGVLTGIVGAPFYFYLLFKQRMKLS